MSRAATTRTKRPAGRGRASAPAGPMLRDARTVLRESARAMARLERASARAVAEAAEALVACLQSGGTAYFCGNGGSAADAQHLACELAGRFFVDRPGLPAVALTTNTSSLTAIGNDFGFEVAYSRQLEGLGRAGDVLVALTTSGASPNVKKAVDVARARGMVVIGFTGARGRTFAASCDYALVSPSDVTPRVQEGHIAMGHALCELVERALFPTEAARGTGPPSGRRAGRRPRPRRR